MMGTAIENNNDFTLAFDGVSAHSVLPDWESKLSQFITSMEVMPLQLERPFRASWQHHDLGDMDVNVIHSPSQRVIHQHIQDYNPLSHQYELLYMTRNAIRLHHSGLETQVRAGEFVLLDNQRPFTFECDREISSVTLHFDESWISRWIPSPHQLVGKAVNCKKGWASPLGALLKTVAQQGLDDVFVPRSVLGDQIGSLIALIPGQRAADGDGNRGRQALYRRLIRTLLDHFQDAGFCPQNAADEMGISKRHLHGVCAGAGTTFSALLMEMRLKKARERLDDFRYRGHRVCDIAFSCGFSDPSHFARRFRSAFGCSPKAYRGAGR